MIKFETQDLMRFFVRGRAYAQTRAKHVQKGDKIVVYSNASKGLKKWKQDCIKEIRAACSVTGVHSVEGAICVDMVFFLPVQEAKRWGQVCSTKPDKDNLEKAVLDCMEVCGVFAVGDSQVGVGQTAKIWCKSGEEGVLVEVKRVRVAPVPEKKEAHCGASEEVLEWLAP